jgi:hypothetical protein
MNYQILQIKMSKKKILVCVLTINVNTLSAVSFVHLFSDNFHWSIGTDFETLNFECFKSVKDAGVTKKVRTVLFA